MEKNSFIVLRHGYDDHSYIDGKNDTSLTLSGIETAKKAMEELVPRLDTKDTSIRHSTKKRAIETAKILRDFLLDKNINCRLVNDYGLTELFQGNFNFEGMTHKERVDFLQSCWDDFEYCRLNGDLHHRFGQNKDRRVILTPGEDHATWSVRIANGLLNIINDLSDNYQSVNITHRGASLEMERLVMLSNGLITMDEVEQYKTIWMSYCSDFTYHIDDLDRAKVLVKKYIDLRSKK